MDLLCLFLSQRISDPLDWASSDLTVSVMGGMHWTKKDIAHNNAELGLMSNVVKSKGWLSAKVWMLFLGTYCKGYQPFQEVLILS